VFVVFILFAIFIVFLIVIVIVFRFVFLVVCLSRTRTSAALGRSEKSESGCSGSIFFMPNGTPRRSAAQRAMASILQILDAGHYPPHPTNLGDYDCLHECRGGCCRGAALESKNASASRTLPRMSLHLKNQSDVLVCGLDQFLGKATVQVDILQLRPWPLGIGSKRPLCLGHSVLGGFNLPQR
jgi:hypothetical protein